MPLISELLRVLAHDSSGIPVVEQDLAKRRYFGKEVPNGGWVPWSLSARQVVDFVRACDCGPWPSPWGRPRTLVSGTEITVLRASLTGEEAAVAPGTVGAPDGDGIRVAAADEWVVIRRLRINGRGAAPSTVLSAADALAGGR